MEELTAGLLFGDTMVMVGGGVVGTAASGQGGHALNPNNRGGGGGVGGRGGGADGEFSSPSPSSYSTNSYSSSSCSPAYYNSNLLPQELFSEFQNDFTAFELGNGGGNNDTLLQHGSSDEERTYMEELISSDLSSDEDKFLETIRYGGGGVVHFSNDLLSEEELVNTIQTYGDVKVVQVDGGAAVDDAAVVLDSSRFVEVVQGEEDEDEELPTGGSVSTGATNKNKCGKKRKSSNAGAGGGSKPVKRTLTVIQQQAASPKKQHHKQASQPRVFEDEIVIEHHVGEVVSSSELLGSPSSPGSPQQQQQDSNGTYQELKLSDEEKRLLMKEGISLPTHYPLTKLEERELKRIRRKIRNKISAQDSRKRKKEFLDRLQMKLQEVEDEKSHLQKRVRSLESINSKLNAQVKRLQQALTSATSAAAASVTGGQQQQQQKQTLPAATTLLVLILSLALVVLPTGLDQHSKNNQDQHGNEIISLLNRSNEMAREQNSRVIGNEKSPPKSRTLVGEEEMDDDDIMDVKELIGQMKTLLRNKRKRSDVVGMVKRGRFDAIDTGGLSGLLGVHHNKLDSVARGGGGGWWVSDGEEDDDEVRVAAKVLSAAGGRFGERKKHAFHIVDDVEVD